MRLPVFLGAAVMTAGILLLAGVAITSRDPTPVVNVDAMEMDGASLLASPPPQVSPRPQLVVRVNRRLSAGDWHVTLDGTSLAVAAAASDRELRVSLPGPLPLGTWHAVELSAGAMRVRATFQVVPALAATIAMHPYQLRADALANIEATIHFSRPVRSQAQAESHITMTGNPTFAWRDPQTVDVVSTGFALGAHAVAMVEPGVAARDGTSTQRSATAGLSIPDSLTQVVPGRMVQMYYVNTDDARAALFAHLKQIDVLSPGWYDANPDGSITGYARRDVIDAAHASGIAIIPLVVNANVDPGVGHAILADPDRRAALARNLVSEAKTYGYAGFQLDFEQIPWTDRDLLTALVQDCAAVFHPAGLNLSIAVIPRLPGDDSAAGVLLDYFHQWSGAYDFAALAKSADFLSFMTYDEHNGVTPPGPVSGIPWMRRALDFSMQGVPADKATLGLPTYYHNWTGVGYLSSSSYADALTLAQRYGAAPAFDGTEDEMHFTYTAYGVHHELWYENGDTLRRKLPLLYEYQLKGISVWRLGFEDPSFWNLIPPRR